MKQAAFNLYSLNEAVSVAERETRFSPENSGGRPSR